MKTLCITGISEPDLLQIGERFQHVGMAQPRSIERNPILNMKEWHTRFFGNAEEDGLAENRPLPGKFGEQLASEIFSSNMEVPFWGWQDSRSTWLLDFWADFDPRLVFLLVCSPLDYQLARKMEIGMGMDKSQPLNVDDIVTAWKQSHEQLLQFYHRFPGRCQLVDVRDCSTQFEAIVRSCHEKWGIPLAVESNETGTPFSSPDSLTQHLAKDFLHNQADAVSLWNELKATLTSFSSPTDIPLLQLNDVVTNLRALGDRSLELQQIATLGQERDKLKTDLAKQVQKLSAIEDQQRETSEENELHLLQLHQVQEELETTFLQKQEADKNCATEREQTQKTNTDLTASRNKLAEQAEQQKSQITTLSQERDKLKTDLTKQIQKLGTLEDHQRETSEENELLLLQLHQVQEELESIFLQKQAGEKNWVTEREQTQKANSDLTASQNKLAEQAEQLQNQVITLVQEQDQLREENADLAASLDRMGDHAEARWKRLQQRHPGYHDYHSLTIAQGDKPSSLIWQISNLEIGSRNFPNLQFETFLLGGVSGFRFTRSGEETPSETSPLLRWPTKMENSQQIDLIPVAESHQEVALRLNALQGLTSSDWALLQSLALFLKARLEDTGIKTDLAAALRSESIAGFDRFLEVIAAFPASLRYDSIVLEQENCSEDCEQLQLVFENLSHGELYSPRFEFRLSCAGLQASEFGNHPRLEFPADTSKVLKSWFDCSDDPEDPRLEMRFALPEAMDLEVWQKLSQKDTDFILMLVEHLPMILQNLRAHDLNLNRSWDQWLSLASNVQQILQLRTTPIEPEDAA